MEDNYDITKVNILGSDYHLKSDLDGEQVKDVSDYVNQEMSTIRECFPKMYTGEIAVLAALRITEKLFKERMENQRFKKQLFGKMKNAQSVLEKMLA